MPKSLKIRKSICALFWKFTLLSCSSNDLKLSLLIIIFGLHIVIHSHCQLHACTTVYNTLTIWLWGGKSFILFCFHNLRSRCHHFSKGLLIIIIRLSLVTFCTTVQVFTLFPPWGTLLLLGFFPSSADTVLPMFMMFWEPIRPLTVSSSQFTRSMHAISSAFTLECSLCMYFMQNISIPSTLDFLTSVIPTASKF